MATVLIVDDDPVNRELMRTLLGSRGHQVLEAGDGVEALAVIGEHMPDLVVADVLMPRMDGYQLVRELRGTPATASVPVVFLSGNYEEEEITPLASAYGVSRVLVKTEDPERVLDAVDDVLAGHPQPAPGLIDENVTRAHLAAVNAKLVQTTHQLDHERTRIAGDLHDLATRRVTEIGASLRNVQHLIESPEARQGVADAAEDLDAIAKIIQTVVFQFQRPQNGQSKDGLTARIAQMTERATHELGFTPVLRLKGLVDTQVPAALGVHAMAVLAEALDNISRHAHASRAEITVAATDTELVLTVTDNGIGIPEGARGSGLTNLSERAQGCGGTFTAVARETGGTQLRWRAPLKQP